MTIKQTRQVPRKTLERLPVYYRILCNLADNGTRRIKSAELGHVAQIDASTIRRDFSCFGELGRSGYGYDIAHLLKILGEILEVSEPQYLGLVGVGNLGRALLKNNFRRNPNISIACAFDADPGLVGEQIDAVTIQSMLELGPTLAARHISTVISTVPSHSLQSVADLLVESGVKSILSFAPEPIVVPKDINLRYLDLTTEVLNLLLLSDAKIAMKSTTVS